MICSQRGRADTRWSVNTKIRKMMSGLVKYFICVCFISPSMVITQEPHELGHTPTAWIEDMADSYENTTYMKALRELNTGKPLECRLGMVLYIL